MCFVSLVSVITEGKGSIYEAQWLMALILEREFVHMAFTSPSDFISTELSVTLILRTELHVCQAKLSQAKLN